MKVKGRCNLENVSCAVFLSLRLALCISDCHPAASCILRRCFCCGNGSVKRFHMGLLEWALFVFLLWLCTFVASGC